MHATYGNDNNNNNNTRISISP